MNPKPNQFGLMQRLFVSFALALPLTAQALPSDKAQSMKVSSKEATLDSKQHVTVLTGEVKITQGTLEINADKITLFYDDKNSLKSLLAEGLPARFQQQLQADKAVVHAEANSITYETGKEHLRLEKNAFVEQKGATTRGGRIDYDMNTDTAHAVGTGNDSGRVEFVIPPQTDKKE